MHFFSLQIYLGDLTAQDVSVEVFSEPSQNDANNVHEMHIDYPIPGTVNGFVYSTTIPAIRPISDYTPRIKPHHPDCIIPLETQHILWVQYTD